MTRRDRSPHGSWRAAALVLRGIAWVFVSACSGVTGPAAGPPRLAATEVDTDGDGVPDRDDLCPAEAEDPDNDNDRIADGVDDCPTSRSAATAPTTRTAAPTAERSALRGVHAAVAALDASLTGGS